MSNVGDRREGGEPDHSAYTERFVGFVDILGFANLVVRADQNIEFRSQIMEALERVNSVAAPTDGESGLRAQNFSDSLILSADRTPVGLWHLLLSVDALAWNLLQIGILIRGGVTTGGIHHDDRTVFGVGVNDAYRLESTVAKYPRIILGKSAIKAAREYSNDDKVWETYRNSRLLRDTDGVWHLNYLSELGVFNRQNSPNSETAEHPLFKVGQDIRDLIQDKIDTTMEQPDVYRKIAWLAEYWNSEVACPAPNGQQKNIGPVTLAGGEIRDSVLPFRHV